MIKKIKKIIDPSVSEKGLHKGVFVCFSIYTYPPKKTELINDTHMENYITYFICVINSKESVNPF